MLLYIEVLVPSFEKKLRRKSLDHCTKVSSARYANAAKSAGTLPSPRGNIDGSMGNTSVSTMLLYWSPLGGATAQSKGTQVGKA